MDTYTTSYVKKDPIKVIRAAEHLKKKNKKHLKPCLDQRHHFTSFMVYFDVLD
jgi:hypothetical protein